MTHEQAERSAFRPEPTTTPRKEMVLGRNVLTQAEFGKAIGDHNGKIGEAMAAEAKAHADIAELNKGLWSVNGTVVSNVLAGTKRTLTIENAAGARTEMTVEGGCTTERDGVNVALADLQPGDQVDCYCDGKTGTLAHVNGTTRQRNAGQFRRGGNYPANAPYPGNAGYSVRQDGASWNVIDAGGNVVKSCHLQVEAVAEMGKLNPETFPNAPHGYPNPNNPNDINPSYPAGVAANLSNPPVNETLKERADREAREAADAANPPHLTNPVRPTDGETEEQRIAREGREAAEDAATRRRGRK